MLSLITQNHILTCLYISVRPLSAAVWVIGLSTAGALSQYISESSWKRFQTAQTITDFQKKAKSSLTTNFVNTVILGNWLNQKKYVCQQEEAGSIGILPALSPHCSTGEKAALQRRDRQAGGLLAREPRAPLHFKHKFSSIEDQHSLFDIALYRIDITISDQYNLLVEVLCLITIGFHTYISF